MKFLALFLLFAVAAAISAPFNSDLNEHWEEFKKTYGKNYDGREEIERRLIWEQNLAEIVKHNIRADMGMHSYRRGINEYVDMSHEEFSKHFNGLKISGHRQSNGSTWVEPKNVLIPDTVDWRKEGLVTPVKSQKKCNSCWSFSTTGSLEGQHKKKTGKLVSLSEQNLIDCSKSEGNDGCGEGGGWPDNAFEYIIKNNGIDTEESYPYTGLDKGQCFFKKESVGATVTGYVDIPTGDEDALKKAVATIGPISVCIDARHPSFHAYKDGIYDDEDCRTEVDNLNHAVIVVGFGSEDGKDYWLIKNSWGTTWGMDGYGKMPRNRNNRCGIATKASYPLV